MTTTPESWMGELVNEGIVDHPGFDEATADRVDQIRVARNAGMYGERNESTPIEFSADDAARLSRPVQAS